MELCLLYPLEIEFSAPESCMTGSTSGGLGGSCLQTTKCRKAPKAAERVAVGVEGFIANDVKIARKRAVLLYFWL